MSYCKEHPRVELQNGKCVACGEVKIEVKHGMTDFMRIAIISSIIMLFFIGIIVYNTAIS